MDLLHSFGLVPSRFILQPRVPYDQKAEIVRKEEVRIQPDWRGGCRKWHIRCVDVPYLAEAKDIAGYADLTLAQQRLADQQVAAARARRGYRPGDGPPNQAHTQARRGQRRERADRGQTTAEVVSVDDDTAEDDLRPRHGPILEILLIILRRRRR